MTFGNIANVAGPSLNMGQEGNIHLGD